MIVDVTEATLAGIRNPLLRAYAGQYVHIYQDFMAQVQQMGVEVEDHDDTAEVRARIAALGEKGALARNDGKSVYVNRISPACQACQLAVGSHTFFVSLKCHRSCFFCFNPNQEEYDFHREHARDLSAELDALRDSGQPVQHLALTGGEPLLFKPETIDFFRRARQDFPQVFTRLYTSGDHLERETLQAFKDAGVNEIRISIRLEDSKNARRHTFEQIALAREYIPNVMVEMPVLPGTLDEMKAVLTELDRLGVFGINLLEFCFPYHNAVIYRRRGYRVKARPFRVLYNYWYAGGLPVAGSETECMELVEFALEEKLTLGVHYCSLENKHTGQVYQQNMAHPGDLNTLCFSQRDYFLKSAKVFGPDAAQASRVLNRGELRAQPSFENQPQLEFHVNQVRKLRKLDIELGIATYVLEVRGGETFLRELKVDVTTPQEFRLADI